MQHLKLAAIETHVADARTCCLNPASSTHRQMTDKQLAAAGVPRPGADASENIFVMTETRAVTQDIRPLQILLLNLMPTKVETETQLARVLGNTPIQIELELIAPSGHVSKNTSQAHMLSFYKILRRCVSAHL